MSEWPNLFLIGAPRCGTTSLHHALSAHPAIFMSHNKEPHFFAELEPTRSYRAVSDFVSDDRAYLRLFEGGRGCPWRGESSTSYLASETALRAIAALPDDPVIVAMVRDPIARAHSHYLHDLSRGLETRSFAEALQDEIQHGPRWARGPVYIAASRYAAGLRRYLEAFGEERVVVILFEEFVRDPDPDIRRLAEALDIDPAPLQAPAREPRNTFGAPRNAVVRRALTSASARRIVRTTLPPVVRARLFNLLTVHPGKPEIEPVALDILWERLGSTKEEVEAVIGRDVPWPSAEPKLAV